MRLIIYIKVTAEVTAMLQVHRVVRQTGGSEACMKLHLQQTGRRGGGGGAPTLQQQLRGHGWRCRRWGPAAQASQDPRQLQLPIQARSPWVAECQSLHLLTHSTCSALRPEFRTDSTLGHLEDTEKLLLLVDMSGMSRQNAQALLNNTRLAQWQHDTDAAQTCSCL